MAVGVPEETRDYVRGIFAELLATRSQRELARELEINQSRVSTALNTGRLAPDTLWKAAKLAGRSEEDVRQHLRRTVAKREPRIRGMGLSPGDVRTDPALVEIATEMSRRIAPSAEPKDMLVAVFAVAEFGYDLGDRKTVRLAYDLIERVHETLELSAECNRLRWMLDTVRRRDPSPLDHLDAWGRPREASPIGEGSHEPPVTLAEAAKLLNLAGASADSVGPAGESPRKIEK